MKNKVLQAIVYFIGIIIIYGMFFAFITSSVIVAPHLTTVGTIGKVLLATLFTYSAYAAVHKSGKFRLKYFAAYVIGLEDYVPEK